MGPAPGGAGGIAVVIDSLFASQLASRFTLVRVVTHVDAGPVRKSLRALTGIAKAALLLATRRVELVYLHTSSGFSLRRKAVVAALANLFGRPYVVHVNSSHLDSWYRDANLADRWLVRRTLGRATLVIAVSPTWEDRLRAIADCRTRAIPNLVSIPEERAHAAAADPRIVSLGRLGTRKGSHTLVRAFARIADRYPTAQLALAGDGDLASVQAEAERLGVRHRVQFMGWIGPDERARTLLEATVFALPARDEGLPVALLEAMAYGLPSVVSPAGGIPDVFEDGRHGFLVPPDDPEALAERLRQILDDPAAAARLGAEARATAEQRFATEVVASQVADALEDALSRHADMHQPPPIRPSSMA